MRALLKRGDRFFDLGGEGRSECVTRLAAERSVAVGCWHVAHVAAEAADRRHSGRKLRHGRGVAVIGVVGGNHPGFAGHGLSHAQRHVIRLAAGAGEDRRVEALVEGRGQPLDIVENAFVQIAGVGVEG